MIVNEISLVIQNKNDIRKLMADKKTKESSKEDYNHQPLLVNYYLLEKKKTRNPLKQIMIKTKTKNKEMKVKNPKS
jgi:hypothetical protein